MTVVMNPCSERSGAIIRQEMHGRLAVIRIERPAKCNATGRDHREPGELKDFQVLKSAEERYCGVVRFCRVQQVGAKQGTPPARPAATAAPAAH